MAAITLATTSLCAQNYPAKPAASSPYSNSPSPPVPVAACPWLTEGSAAAALGGSVRVKLNITGLTEGVCTFTAKDAPQRQIRLVVGSANVPACPPGSPELVGIGTRANRCLVQPSHDAGSRDAGTQMISGKVRAVNMAVTFSGGLAAATPGTDYRAPVTIDQIAEQVAGNLF